MVRSLLGIPAEEERKRAFRIVFGTAVGAAVAAGADYEEESLGGREDCREEMRHPRILLLPCSGNILLLRSEAGRTMSGREPTFLLAGCSALDTGTGRGVFA